MHIKKVVIKNYRSLRDSTIELNPELNVIVGANECGKSTLLEAIHLALSGQLNGRQIQQELHPHLFNTDEVRSYVKFLQEGSPKPPPSILVELYFAEDPEFARIKGKNNSHKEDVPGVKLAIKFNDEYIIEYNVYVEDPSQIRSIPVEYYKVEWRDFADNDITSRSVPIKPSFIDTSAVRSGPAASKYILDIVRAALDEKQQVDLALSYRLMRDRFLEDPTIKKVNKDLEGKKTVISEKNRFIVT